MDILSGATPLIVDVRQSGSGPVVREQLVAMAIGAPTPEVRRLVRDLEGALDSSLLTTWFRLNSRRGGLNVPVLAKFAENGKQEHFQALALLDELIEAL